MESRRSNWLVSNFTMNCNVLKHPCVGARKKGTSSLVCLAGTHAHPQPVWRAFCSTETTKRLGSRVGSLILSVRQTRTGADTASGQTRGQTVPAKIRTSCHATSRRSQSDCQHCEGSSPPLVGLIHMLSSFECACL